MSDMYGQYGIFVDDHNWEYNGAWSYFYFDMKNMKMKRVSKREDDPTITETGLVIKNEELWTHNGNGGSFRLADPIQGEYKRYQHWLFERVVLLEE